MRVLLGKDGMGNREEHIHFILLKLMVKLIFPLSCLHLFTKNMKYIFINFVI